MTILPLEEIEGNFDRVQIWAYFDGHLKIIKKLVVSLPGKTCVACDTLFPKFRKTGSEHAPDSKMSYTIQFSILMLCVKYQKAGISGSSERLTEIFLYGTYIKNSKQEVDMPEIQNCLYMIHFSILMLCAKYQETIMCGS